MKHWKQAAALVLTGLMALSLAACSPKGRDPAQAIAAAKEALSAATSLNAHYDTETTYAMAEESFKSLSTMDLTLISAPARRMKAEIVLSMPGINQQKVTMYALEEDGKQVQYLTDGTSWNKGAAPADLDKIYNVWDSIDKYLSVTEGMKAAGQEQVDGREATRYDGTIGGKNLVQVLEEMGGLKQISTMSQDQQTKIKTDLEGIPPLKVSLWIDKEGSYPAKFEADLTQTMADMQAQISKTLGGFESEDGITVTGALVRITCSNVGAAVDFQLPAEAASAQES